MIQRAHEAQAQAHADDAPNHAGTALDAGGALDAGNAGEEEVNQKLTAPHITATHHSHARHITAAAPQPRHSHHVTAPQIHRIYTAQAHGARVEAEGMALSDMEGVALSEETGEEGMAFDNSEDDAEWSQDPKGVYRNGSSSSWAQDKDGVWRETDELMETNEVAGGSRTRRLSSF